MEHRTYLWLHLVFDVIAKRSAGEIKKKAEVESSVKELPSTVDEAYQEMLEGVLTLTEPYGYFSL